jgi:ArsR family transcriptional regulator
MNDMVASKKNEFTQKNITLASFAKALAHPARLAILQVLTEKNSCICGDIVDEMPLSQATVSQHLKELKEIGVIQGEIDGPRVCYCIDKKKLNQFVDSFSDFVKELDLKKPLTKKYG